MWAEIDLDAIAQNMKEIRRITNKKAQIMAAVKADGYGHGAVETAKTLLQNGADRLAVATVGEGRELRNAGITAPIMILGMSGESDIEDLLRLDLTPAVCEYSFAEKLGRVADEIEKWKKVKIHIKLDTGMTRIGYVTDNGENTETIDEIVRISKLPNIEIEGIFSHLATADEADSAYTRLQFRRFMYVVQSLEERGVHIPIKHICNSAGIIKYPEMHLDMVRPGIILYGLYPSNEVKSVKKPHIKLIPAMSLKAAVRLVKTVEAGRGVSYGKTYITDGVTKIATIPIGYADGYIRALAGKAKMMVNGEKAPVIGRICMDQCMIDVTNVHNIHKGDEVTVFGREGVTIDDAAEWLGTINYEIACMVARRVPRVYKRDGRTVKISDYLKSE